MLNVNLKKAFAVFAAQLAVAMAPMPNAQAPVTHFVDDRGELVSVDSPDSSSQPVFVAIPVGTRAEAPVQQSGKNSTSKR